MPLMRCQKNGKSGWKFGKNGHCYTGKDAKLKAIKQGFAINPDEMKKYLASSDISDDEAIDIMTVANCSMLEIADLLLAKKMSRKEINDLPDDAFAYIEPGGKKDKDGKTTPRSLRHLPIHTCNHVRNALARLSQTKISEDAKKKAFKKISKAAKKCKINISDEMTKKYG